MARVKSRIGKQYRIDFDHHMIVQGSVVKLVEDDKTDIPWFRLVSGEKKEFCDWDMKRFALVVARLTPLD